MMLILLLSAVVAALALAAVNVYDVKRRDPGTLPMREIALAIQVGADAFLRLEYRIIFKVSLAIMAVLWLLVDWYVAAAYVLGATLSAAAGWAGMKMAVIANVRVANTARQSNDIGKTLKVAFQGGSVMGLCVGGFALLGLALVYGVFGLALGQLDPAELVFHRNGLGIYFVPFTMTVAGYALGCSVIAMFNRVGGGIFTKAADMGADLVGKTEVGIPEDDARNPATIADNVGDNVGDVAGLGSDMLESYVGALISAVVLAIYAGFSSSSTELALSDALRHKLIGYPLIVAAIGLLSSSAAILRMMLKSGSGHPHRDLNGTTLTAAVLTVSATGIATWVLFRAESAAAAGFTLGPLSPWLCALFGLIGGILIGRFAEYHTSYDYAPTRRIAAASCEGPALNVTQGIAAGMQSVFSPMLALGICIVAAHAAGGLYGVAMAAVGMLSLVAVTVSVDTYGPIADNAGGISVMAGLDHKVRDITDRLDAVGNTTAAVGKGFAIGSAALTTLSLFVSFLYAQACDGAEAGAVIDLTLDMMHPLSLVGALVGAAIPCMFSGILIRAVVNAARKMVREVRRQFHDDPGIMAGSSKPDYHTCVSISSAGALAEMKLPALLVVGAPLVTGFIFGPDFVGGLLIGATLVSIVLALFTANAGGAWDNAKKLIEQGEHGGKGSDAHKAAVVGDTVGDPLKDTVGPSLNIQIKIMSVVSLIAGSIFSRYNLFALF